MEEEKNFENTESFNKDSEINLIFFYNIFLRNKIIFAIFTLAISFFALIYSSFKKPIWQGQFEIVIKLEKESNSNNMIPSDLLRLASNNMDQTNSSLLTEVGILKSPSVLLPIYEYVISEKKNKDPNFKKVDFISWRKDSLNIELKDTTSILEITYKDTNKEIIKPVLNKISKEYQKYSGKNKRRNLKLAQVYLNNQISKYKTNSSKSFSAAQSFAIDQDLVIFEFLDDTNEFNKGFNKGFNTDNSSNMTNIFVPNVSIESVRSKASNAIKTIELKIKKIKELGPESYQYIVSLIPNNTYIGLTEQLSKFERKILELKAKYKENDKELSLVIKKRDLIVDLLKDKTIGYLEVQKLNLKATMETAIRPKGVLLKYKELMREAARDEVTLVKLEDQIRLTNLEASRLEDPWELITKPYLNEYPFSNKKVITFIGLISGLLISFLISVIREKKSGLIYEEETLKNILNTKILEKIKLEEFPNYLKANVDSETIFSFNKNAKFLYLDKLNETNKKDDINLIFQKEKIKIINNFQDISDNDRIYLITSLKFLELNQIKKLSNRLEISNLEISGIFLLE